MRSKHTALDHGSMIARAFDRARRGVDTASKGSRYTSTQMDSETGNGSDAPIRKSLLIERT
eukprot:1728383-Lingulodinium_polyedra.AAC.1